MHQAGRVCCTDHTDSIFARIERSFHLKYAFGISSEIAEGYSLGMVKIKAFDQFHFMQHAVRVCRTAQNDSINARIACSFLLKYAS